MKENKSLRSWRLLALVVIGQFLWPSVLVWPAVAYSQQETHWPTHYVIVVRNTSLNHPVGLIPESEFRAAIASIPSGLAAASGQISLWRKPQPGDLISVMFAAAEKDPRRFTDRGCETYHYPDPAIPGQSSNLDIGTYFDVRAHIVVEEHNSPSDIANPSSKLHQELLQSLVVEDCDLIATSYSEALTLAKSLPFVEIANANRKENYKQFFLLVFDFASPAYGSTEFNATFDVLRDDFAPGTPVYLNAPIGSLKFSDGDWSVDLLNYLDYPAHEPGGTTHPGPRNPEKFYPRIRFYRAIAHETHSDPFYGLTSAQRETERLNLEVVQLEHGIDQRDQEMNQLKGHVNQLKGDVKEARTIALLAGIATAIFALLMVFVAWQWWASKGHVRKAREKYQEELKRIKEEQSTEFMKKQAASEAEKEKLKSQLKNAICIPDAHKANEASEFA